MPIQYPGKKIQKSSYPAVPTEEKVAAITGWLLEKKARDLLALDLTKERVLCEAVIIVTASSTRHAKGLADFIREQAKASRYEFLRIEGAEAAQWILLDLNDVVVHIFQPETRELYRLDDLWPAATVISDLREER